jgi:hypothetical protein
MGGGASMNASSDLVFPDEFMLLSELEKELLLSKHAQLQQEGISAIEAIEVLKGKYAHLIEERKRRKEEDGNLKIPGIAVVSATAVDMGGHDHTLHHQSMSYGSSGTYGKGDMSTSKGGTIAMADGASVLPIADEAQDVNSPGLITWDSLYLFMRTYESGRSRERIHQFVDMIDMYNSRAESSESVPHLGTLRDQNGWNLLHHAVNMCHYVDFIAILVERARVPIDDADRDGNNAMHMAAKNGRMDIINYFIGVRSLPQLNIKLNLLAENNEGFNATEVAYKYGKHDVMRVLKRVGVAYRKGACAIS